MVELGAYRGATCAALAPLTRRTYVAVDPYVGYGGGDRDLARLRERIAGLSNVVHERATSGAAARAWRHGPVSFLFVDAAHDFVDTAFDLAVWEPLCAPGAVVALHDTDSRAYAGTRLAVWRYARRARLLAHVDGLVVLERPPG